MNIETTHKSKSIPLFTKEERREHWQLEMSSKSLKKWSKLEALLAFVGNRVVQIDGTKLGFASKCMDRVVAIDCLEHVVDDAGLMREILRVLKDDGTAVISVPQTGPFFMLHRLASLCGLKPSFYGHVREGYSPKHLRELIESSGMRVIGHSYCSRFITEAIELSVNVAYLFLLNKKGTAGIAPASESALKKHGFSFRLFSAIYPFLWLMSRLDGPLFWSKGYILILKAVKESAK